MSSMEPIRSNRANLRILLIVMARSYSLTREPKDETITRYFFNSAGQLSGHYNMIWERYSGKGQFFRTTVKCVWTVELCILLNI